MFRAYVICFSVNRDFVTLVLLRRPRIDHTSDPISTFELCRKGEPTSRLTSPVSRTPTTILGTSLDA